MQKLNSSQISHSSGHHSSPDVSKQNSNEEKKEESPRSHRNERNDKIDIPKVSANFNDLSQHHKLKSVFKNDSFARASGSDGEFNDDDVQAEQNNIFHHDSIFDDPNEKNLIQQRSRDRILEQRFPHGPF